MLARRLLLGLALLIPAAAFTGCIGADEEPIDEGTIEPENLEPEGNENATLPDGRGESAGIIETNKTEEGVGGVDHKHDYWKGRETVDLLKDKMLYFAPLPLYPDGDGSSAKSVAYVKLPCTPLETDPEACEPALVYEGADKVIVTITNPALHPECEIFACPDLYEEGIEGQEVPRQSIPHPSPPKVSLQWRSAADSDWTAPVPLAYDAPYEIVVEPQQTDMPHSVRSLWVFRLTADGTNSFSADLTVQAHKGREVVDWPGHPDFYAEDNIRKVADKPVSTYMSGIKEGYLYDSGGTWAAPEKLISHGTSRLLVIANVTSVQATGGLQPTGFFLEYHDATVIGPEIRFGERLGDRNFNNDLKTYEFEIEVDPQGMDGPYQPGSRWGFRLMATFTDIDIPREIPEVGGTGVGLCPACFEYSIEYNLVVIAVHDEGDDGSTM